MEYSSSEDDELIEDFVDLEDANDTPDVDQSTSSVHFVNHDGNSMAAVQNSVGDELVTIDGDVKNQEPYLGMEFESESAARLFYNSYALRLGFGIRVARSRSERRKGVEVLVMKRFVCLKEGHHKKKVTELSTKKKRKRLSIRDGCPAMMEVVRRGPEKWVVTKLVLEHTHVIVSPDKVREIQLHRLSGKYREHENYLREMRQKVFGDADAQGLLDYFKKMQAENSGFFYAMQVDGRNCMTNAVWVDAKARMSYTYFGDAVTFDTSYRQNENMMPFAAFTGVNHHGQPVVFGCALVVDRTESSFSWLFETWLTAMFKRHPVSFTSDQGKAIGTAVAKVFPQTNHRLCRWRILSRCKKKLSDVYSRYPTLHEEIKKCVNESDTVDMFDIYWSSIIDRYNLRENSWLQSLFNLRQKWIPAYLTGSFFAELSTTQRLESMNRFYRRNFDMKVSLQTFIAKFDQAIDRRYSEECQTDLAMLPPEQILKTDTVMEKQAASIYTREVFEKFQVELVESFHHYPVKIQDGPYSKYSVERVGDAHNRHAVYFNASEKKVWCNCCKFALSGIPCRHMLAVFLLTGVIMLPELCVAKRWTRKAKTGPEPDESDIGNEGYCQNSPILRYNDLVRDAMKCAEKGAISAETFRVAKDMLRKAFAEITNLEEKMAKSGPHLVANT
ncbi:protein FAR1-RELATED SEQUENCE 5-like [Typha angustifolia]|uniref:protein FAR1-RELATED SEQUENCE 5-like n=1 Tax=Typha angustifolia TaxID=59011 RepID=UPI003C2C80EA